MLLEFAFVSRLKVRNALSSRPRALSSLLMDARNNQRGNSRSPSIQGMLCKSMLTCYDSDEGRTQHQWIAFRDRPTMHQLIPGAEFELLVSRSMPCEEGRRLNYEAYLSAARAVVQIEGWHVQPMSQNQIKTKVLQTGTCSKSRPQTLGPTNCFRQLATSTVCRITVVELLKVLGHYLLPTYGVQVPT